VDEEEFAEELRAPQIDLIAGAVIDRLQNRDEHPESQSQRHHPEVVDGGDSELPPSDEDWVQIHGISVRARTLFLRHVEFYRRSKLRGNHSAIQEFLYQSVSLSLTDRQ